MKRSLFSWLVGLLFALLVAGLSTPAFAATPATPLRIHVSAKKNPPQNNLSQVRGSLLRLWVAAPHSGETLGCRCVSCLGLAGTYSLPV